MRGGGIEGNIFFSSFPTLEMIIKEDFVTKNQTLCKKRQYNCLIYPAVYCKCWCNHFILSVATILR